jgi:hypothetical protein
MEIRRFNPLPWHRALIWVALNVAFTGGAIATIWVDAPVHMCVVGIVAAIVTGILTTRHVLSYFAFAKRISFYTRQGLAVVGSSAVDWLVAHQDELEDNIDQAITWFERWIVDHATRTVPIGRVRDYINGGQLWVAVQAGPLHDARWNLTARGFTWGNRSQVWYPQNGTNGPDLYLKGFAGSTVEKVFLSVIRHEVAQQCLNAMNIPPELHQKWLDEQGCPDR